MHTPTVFCLTCGRYLGVAQACIFCGWERPAALRIPAAGAPLWRLPTAAPADGQPLVMGDTVILADRTGALVAVSCADGAISWRWAGAGPLRGALAGRGARVYAAQREGDLLAFNLGHVPGNSELPGTCVRWRLPLVSPGAPAVDEGRITIGSGEGTVTALTDAGERPEVAWRTPVGGRVALAPVPWRRLLLVATSHAQGHLVALDAGRGMVVWSQPLGARAAVLLLPAPRRGGVGGGAARVKTGIAQAGDQVALVLTDRGLARAFRLPDGEPLDWTYQVAGAAPVAAAANDGAVYLAGGRGEVVALDPLTGAARLLADYDDPVIGLAVWEGLLYVAGRGGVLHVLNAADGIETGRWDAGRPLTAGPVVVDGAVLVGDEAGWSALPWHLGQWRWAAARFQARGNLNAAAACHALANEPDVAEQAWLAAGAPERPAWFWDGVGEVHRAAAAFRRAAEGERTRQPALAAAYLNQAADRLEVCDAPVEATECRKLAARMGRFPHLRLKLTNISVAEAGEKMTAEVEVDNVGNAIAEQVRFRLGGRLARSVAGELPGPLAAGASDVLEFFDLVPTASGRERLTVSVTCGGECGPAVRADASFEFDVAEPPPGAVRVDGDAGGVILRVREGAPLPRVHVKGMAGMIKVEIV